MRPPVIAIIGACVSVLLLMTCGAPEVPDKPTQRSVQPSKLEYAPLPPPIAPSVWAVRLSTTGGFTGMGKGAVSVHSDRTVMARLPCKLPEDRLSAVEHAVATATPET